jgi:hypothetical protein
MDRDDERWFGTEEAGRRLGMSSEWVRRQVIAGRLRAVVYRTEPRSRAIYRIRADWLVDFQARFSARPGE